MYKYIVPSFRIKSILGLLNPNFLTHGFSHGVWLKSCFFLPNDENVYPIPLILNSALMAPIVWKVPTKNYGFFGGCLILALNLAYSSHKWDCFTIYNHADTGVIIQFTTLKDYNCTRWCPQDS